MAGDCYEKLLKLGFGSFGTAWLVSKKGCKGNNVVMKEVNLRGMREKDINQALTEVEVLARCKHESIISYKEAFFNKEVSILSIVMEYASLGDLHKQITQRRGLFFTDETILAWFSQLVSALDYIHTRCILHRDVKPQNLFLTSKQSLKLGDFGIARVFTSLADKACTFIGTPFYLSPEVCRQEPYSYASDMWSAGCVLYEMCCLCVPFTASTLAALVTQIELARYTPLSSHCSQILHDLVQSLLTSDPGRRPSAVDIIKMNIAQRIGTQESPNWKRKGLSPANGERGAKIAKKIVDATTYTVVKHPKAQRPSLASPELSAMIQKQRRTQPLEGLRVVASADNPPRPPRGLLHHNQRRSASPAPCFNLFESESKSRHQCNQKGLQDKHITEDSSQSKWDLLSREVYKVHLSSSSSDSQKATALQHCLVNCLGYGRFERLLQAVREKTDFEKLITMDESSSKVLPFILMYVQLADS